jgi:hypothetical protein
MVLVWIGLSATYSVPEIRVAMTEREVEAVLGKPFMSERVDGAYVAGSYHADPRWVLGRQGTYIITFDGEGRVAGYDLIESGFLATRRTHR